MTEEEDEPALLLLEELEPIDFIDEPPVREALTFLLLVLEDIECLEKEKGA